MQDISFRLVQPEDLPQMAAFCAQFPGDGRSVEFWSRRFQHWWQDNPAMTDDWLRGYQLFVDGKLQGVCLSIPLRGVIKGEPHTAALGSTWRVMPQFKAYSMALAYEVGTKQSHLLCFNGTPSAKVRKILKYSHICRRTHLLASFHPGNWFALLAKSIKKTRATKAIPKINCTAPACSLSDLQEIINNAWSAVADKSTGPVRDWKYWSWFSIYNPTVACSTFILLPDDIQNNSPLCALVADFGDGRLVVTDLWPLTASAHKIPCLLKWIFSTAKQYGFHSIVVPHWNSVLIEAVSSLPCIRTIEISAEIWTNPFPTLTEPIAEYWPLHTGDALL